MKFRRSGSLNFHAIPFYKIIVEQSPNTGCGLTGLIWKIWWSSTGLLFKTTLTFNVIIVYIWNCIHSLSIKIVTVNSSLKSSFVFVDAWLYSSLPCCILFWKFLIWCLLTCLFDTTIAFFLDFRMLPVSQLFFSLKTELKLFWFGLRIG